MANENKAGNVIRDRKCGLVSLTDWSAPLAGQLTGDVLGAQAGKRN